MKFYITTAIPYVNAPPHIGHALDFLHADVVARHERLQGKEVFFLTGTDDNGLKNYQTALKLGKNPQEFVDENSAIFRDFLHKLNISNDDFIRTTDRDRHWPTAQKVWRQLLASDDLYRKTYKGFYCVPHESFHPESELANGECPDYPGRPLEIVEEENYFFRLSKYAEDLKRVISSGEFQIFPESKKNEMLSLIEQGLEDISFSRLRERVAWGIPVPDDPEQVIYVWCDALTNYLSGVEYAQAGAKFQKFWPPDLQVVGKDIARFHALIWPAMLLSAKLPLPKALLVHGFITSRGQKMSKSIGNVVDPFLYLEKYGAEPLRYFLLREIPATEDGDFTEARFLERYNSDLANGLGNLTSRILTLGEKYQREIELKTNDLEEDIQANLSRYEDALSRYQFHEVLSLTWQLISRLDSYLNEKEPWKLLGLVDREEGIIDAVGHILSSATITLASISWMIEPFLPETSKEISRALQLDGVKKEDWLSRKVELKKIEPLFPRIEKQNDN
ncbi:MAG: methionine--tRNA ligase [Parcubacteria group bacterium]|nr:methionine--tRNA ligase [Parcubacteria group bacterium]